MAYPRPIAEHQNVGTTNLMALRADWQIGGGAEVRRIDIHTQAIGGRRIQTVREYLEEG